MHEIEGHVQDARAPLRSLSLVVDLVKPENVERLPESLSAAFMGVTVRRFAIDPFEVSAAAKIRLALTTPEEDMLET